MLSAIYTGTLGETLSNTISESQNYTWKATIPSIHRALDRANISSPEAQEKTMFIIEAMNLLITERGEELIVPDSAQDALAVLCDVMTGTPLHELLAEHDPDEVAYDDKRIPQRLPDGLNTLNHLASLIDPYDARAFQEFAKVHRTFFDSEEETDLPVEGLKTLCQVVMEFGDLWDDYRDRMDAVAELLVLTSIKHHEAR